MILLDFSNLNDSTIQVQLGFNASLSGFVMPKATLTGMVRDAQHHWTSPEGQLGCGRDGWYVAGIWWDMMETWLAHSWHTTGTQLGYSVLAPLLPLATARDSPRSFAVCL